MYYVYAWVVDQTIIMLQSNTEKESGNPQPQIECDYYIFAEVNGEFVDAGTLLQTLSLDGQTLVGADFISQTVEAI
jgi:hypothetical protein